ncbi:MAG: hypothetical protein K8R02_01545 [Anaerohalosphaeraceae bacterium]|nr:hypothetical protein [Anaerohalosphaeraceae bacterium]
MKTRIFAAFLVCFLAFSTICFAADVKPAPKKGSSEKVELKLRLKVGEKRDMKMTQVNNITQTMQGQEMKMAQEMEMVMGYEVLAVEPNGLATMKVTYKSMKMKMTSPEMSMEYDSTKPAEDSNDQGERMMRAAMSCMTGGELTMKVKPNGEVSDVNGMAEMMKKTIEGAGPEAEMMKSMMSKMFDEKKMKDSMGQMFAIFPDGPVGVGDAWYDDLGIDIGFPIDISTTYMLTKREKGLAYIDASAKMDMGDSAQKIEMAPGMSMGFQFAGVISQASVIDETNGWALSSSGAMNLTGVMSMEPSPQMPEGMKMPMKIDGTFKVETVDVK